MPRVLEAGPLGRLAAPLLGAPGRAAVGVQLGDRQVPPTAASLAATFPGASGRLVVFVAEPGASADCWDRHTDQVGASYGERLALLLDWTPVRLHCEPLPVAELAVELASTLQRLVDGWPLEVSRLVLVGHGAGGLAVRAAAGVRSHGSRPWPTRVSDVVLLGTPLLAAAGPRYAVPLGRRLEEQLGGITSVQPDAEPLEGATYTSFTTRGPDTGNAVGRALGEVLWWRHRLGGRQRRAHALFPTATEHQVDAGDVGLVNHPQVHRALLELLA